MQIKADWRDQFPKLGLNGVYIGDNYPLCHELPERAFLHQGAIYRYLGSDPNPKTMSDDLDEGVTRFVLDTSSDLYNTLCDPDPGTNSCRYKSEIVLPSNLACTGKECDVDTLRVIQVGATSLSTPIFYEYVQQPCVNYAFYDETHGNLIGNTNRKNGRCGDSRLPLATVPCQPDGKTYGDEICGLNYHGERTTVATGSQRCLDEGLGTFSFWNWMKGRCKDDDMGGVTDSLLLYWSPAKCQTQVQVIEGGKISIVHELHEDKVRGST